MSDLIRVAAFPSAGELALQAADERGLLRAAGLDVEITEVRGAHQQLDGFREGRYDVLHTAADNVLALRDEGVDAVIVAGVNRGLLTLVGAPDVALSDLLERPIGVDSAASGYVIVLRHALRLAGIDPDACEMVEIGGTRERAQALADGRVAATLLTPPYDVAALRDGGRPLLRPTDVVPRFVGAIVIAMRPWAAAHDDALARYLGALRDAQRWLRDPAERAGVEALVAARGPVDPALAPDVLGVALDPACGLLPDGRLEVADLESVAEVRRAAGRGVPVDVAAALDLR